MAASQSLKRVESFPENSVLVVVASDNETYLSRNFQGKLRISPRRFQRAVNPVSESFNLNGNLPETFSAHSLYPIERRVASGKIITGGHLY